MLTLHELIDPISMYGGRVNTQQAAEMRKKFDELKQLVNETAPDHVMIKVISEKLDLMGEILLGNSHPEEGVVVQVRLLREWQMVVNRIAILFAAPILLTSLLSILGLIWLLIVHKATLTIP